MEIITPDAIREIVTLTYTWNAGMSLDLHIDEVAGDYIKDMGDSLHIHMAAKPSFNNSGEMMGEEDVVIYKSTLASIITRRVKIRLASLDELEELHNLYPKVTSIQ
jgi:hypothetical protein